MFDALPLGGMVDMAHGGGGWLLAVITATPYVDCMAIRDAMILMSCWGVRRFSYRPEYSSSAGSWLQGCAFFSVIFEGFLTMLALML